MIKFKVLYIQSTNGIDECIEVIEVDKDRLPIIGKNFVVQERYFFDIYFELFNYKQKKCMITLQRESSIGKTRTIETRREAENRLKFMENIIRELSPYFEIEVEKSDVGFYDKKVEYLKAGGMKVKIDWLRRVGIARFLNFDDNLTEIEVEFCDDSKNISNKSEIIVHPKPKLVFRNNDDFLVFDPTGKLKIFKDAGLYNYTFTLKE
ncbi:MAG: hypothetical protein QXF12_04310 [Candidatus Aenigmatarchaeota archaeon]